MPFDYLILILFITCFAAFINSAFGFGEGLINMSILTFYLNLDFTAPFVALLSGLGSIYIMVQDRNQWSFGNVGPMLVGALLGTPFGIWLANYSDGDLMRKFLGTLVAAFSLYNLLKPKLGKLHNDRWALLFGATGGVLGGAYNISGPPVVIYGNLRQWTPSVFRATLQAYFAPISAMAVLGHGLSGKLNGDVLWMVLFAIPTAFIGILLGRWINTRMSNPKAFQRLIYAMLLIVGILLLLR